MRATVYCQGEGGEPAVLHEAIRREDSGLGENGSEYTTGEVLSDLLPGGLEDIYIVSEQALNVALHALHGALAAQTHEEARRWVDAGLRELAFYDVDGIETEEAPELHHSTARASRPGIGEFGSTGFVEWPASPGGSEGG